MAMQGGDQGGRGGYGPPPGQPAPSGYAQPPQQPYAMQPQGYPPPQGHAPPQGYALQQAYAPPQAYGMAPQRGQCQACSRHAPLKQVHFMQNIGLLILRLPKSVKGYLCKRCISKYFWEMTTITFFFGWWGLISFFYTLVSIPVNIGNYVGARSLPDE